MSAEPIRITLPAVEWTPVVATLTHPLTGQELGTAQLCEVRSEPGGSVTFRFDPPIRGPVFHQLVKVSLP